MQKWGKGLLLVCHDENPDTRRLENLKDFKESSSRVKFKSQEGA